MTKEAEGEAKDMIIGHCQKNAPHGSCNGCMTTIGECLGNLQRAAEELGLWDRD